MKNIKKNIKFIRNFSIISHIDHGKSTLADRLIESTGLIPNRKFKDRILDSMDIERERGITIKSQTISLFYKRSNYETYNLNLIDTPGHVDFSYEVSRALASCEGAILLIDSSQGVEAQTLANMYIALDLNLKIIPVINKIDLPFSNISQTKKQIENDLGLDPNLSILTSAKNGIGISTLIESILEYLPPPSGNLFKPLKAIIFDSNYDQFKGAIIHVKIIDGRAKSGDIIRFMSNNKTYKIEEVGIFQIIRVPKKILFSGEVGYIIAGIKTVESIKCGDTVTLEKKTCISPFPGFKKSKPVVFSSIYPINSEEYKDLSNSLAKLKLNDASLIYEKISSNILGFGFRCGFLGLLHLEIIQERLEREYNLSLILTYPSVSYKLIMNNKEEKIIDNPVLYPSKSFISKTMEPFVKACIIVPNNYIGSIMNLCIKKRGISKNYQYLSNSRVEMIFEIPLAEIIYDFYDKLKSISQGYASLDYEIIGYKEANLTKIDIMIDGIQVNSLAQITHVNEAYTKAKLICDGLKKEIPRQMYKIAIQGKIENKVIARSTISAFKKNVTAKCYGGDITRKRKLIEKQKKGKKKMKMIGKISIPQSAFLSFLKRK